MSTVSRIIYVTATFLILTANAHAANPHEELKQLTAQLQSNPSDTALREKIIKLALTLKPVPSIPAEAERLDGRGEYAFKSAKKESDYLAAAQEFAKASNAAPWVASFYFNAGTAYEKAQQPLEAKRSFELYLLAAPNAQDAREVRRRIAGLEFAIEKAKSPEVVDPNIEGARFSRIVDYPQVVLEEIYEVRGGTISLYSIPQKIIRPNELGPEYRVGSPMSSGIGNIPLNGLVFTYETGFVVVQGEITSDGNLLVAKITNKGGIVGASTGSSEVRKYRRK